MGRRFSALLLGLAGLILTLGQSPARGADIAAATSTEVGRVIVRFKPNADTVRARAMSRSMSRSEVVDITQTRATSLAMRHGFATAGAARMRGGRALDERTQVVVASGISSAALAAKLGADSEVEFVAVDQRRKRALSPNDPIYGGATIAPVTIDGNGISQRTLDQWYLKAPTGDVVSSISAPGAWDITTGSASVVVAVVDTGVRFDHPDLASKFIATTDTTSFPSGFVGYDFVGFAENGSATSIATANDGNGADGDASDPGDWVSQADITAGKLGSGCTTDDIDNSSWHGTRVSGLIGALTNNGTGMAGVAWNSLILPVRVLGKCGGYDSDIMAGMLWAAGIAVPGIPANPNKAKVINMSLGGSGSCTGSGTGTYPGTISQVIAAGTTIVVAAGNSEGEAVGVPGNCSGVITVAGLRHAGSKVGFSSIGPQVTIAAPGGNCVNVDLVTNAATGPCIYTIQSTVNLGTTTPGTNGYTGTTASVGTSFSTPLVAGTVALMLAANSSLTPAQVKTILQATARPFVSTGGSAGTQQCRAPSSATQDECYCTTSTCGAGMLDAAAAVNVAQAGTTGTVTVTASPANPTAGDSVTLTASSSLASGRTASGTSWALISGGGAASSVSATGVVVTTGAGAFTVRATVTDDLGLMHTGDATITVAAAPSSGGGGGGAFSPLWLALLGLACVALRPRRAG